MAVEAIKDLAKPPFANYDLVVYFGTGLFCIPFINRYVIKPFDLKWPKFYIEMETKIASDVVSTLSILFCIYIIGHIIAYSSSQFIEKSVDRVLGKVSTAIIVTSHATGAGRNSAIRKLIHSQIIGIKRDKAIWATLLRVIFHIPVIPAYLFIYVFGVFGYYNTRISKPILFYANKKIKNIGIGEMKISLKTKWFKPLEYYVINKIPSASNRMYNYLTIGGLFRSVCIIFLSSLWFQLYYFIHKYEDGHVFLHPIMGSRNSNFSYWEYAIISILYVFCLFSYIKFQRRYAEEAIFAFVFE